MTFHQGELDVQTRAGERATADQVGRMVGDVVMKGARPFVSRVRTAAFTTSSLWPELWLGEPGMLATEDGKTVQVSHAMPDGDVALLAIELETRRRLRINGVASGGVVAVRESYPNCPKYIHPRRLVRDDAFVPDPHVSEGTQLGPAQIDLVARADTAFVASRHPERGLDVSHRGGPKGFIRVRGNELVIPDYPGNSMFNTLGNFAVDPEAGILIVDFERARLLKVRGKVTLFIDGDDRSWTLAIESWRDEPAPAAYRWED